MHFAVDDTGEIAVTTECNCRRIVIWQITEGGVKEVGRFALANVPSLKAWGSWSQFVR